MTKNKAKNLRVGDVVFWNDPDVGICSRSLHIKYIEFLSETVIIVDYDGSETEFLYSELS